MKGSRYDVYIFSPTGNRFRSKAQLQEYLDKNTQLGINIDQFSFSLTKDKNGPKHGLTKLIRSTAIVADQERPNQKDDKASNNEKSELKEISSKLQPLSSKNSALNLIIPPPPTT